MLFSKQTDLPNLERFKYFRSLLSHDCVIFLISYTGPSSVLSNTRYFQPICLCERRLKKKFRNPEIDGAKPASNDLTLPVLCIFCDCLVGLKFKLILSSKRLHDDDRFAIATGKRFKTNKMKSLMMISGRLQIAVLSFRVLFGRFSQICLFDLDWVSNLLSLSTVALLSARQTVFTKFYCTIPNSFPDELPNTRVVFLFCQFISRVPFKKRTTNQPSLSPKSQRKKRSGPVYQIF